MVNPLHIEHAEEKSHYELREQFRAENLKRVQSQLRDHMVPRWDPTEQKWDMVPSGFKVMGETMADRGIFLPKDRGEFMQEELNSREEGFEMSDDSKRVGEQLSRLAKKTIETDKVTIPGAADLDAPACDLDSMTDDQICDYYEDVLERSRK